VIGVPDLRLFIRGDEVEMHRRLVRSGLPFGTALGAVYLHPRADGDDKPMLGGACTPATPDDP
jgi:rhamnopyranosyl-N-acetylglucosaminyl-diphospho-decaprenol beta-1,3/1,4-galactofuranosyltransferase